MQHSSVNYKKTFRAFITFEIYKVRRLYNWLIYNELWLVLILLFGLVLLGLSFLKHNYLNNSNTSIAVLYFTLLAIMPVSVNKSLLNHDRKSDPVLLSILNQKEFILLKQIQTIVVNIIVYFLLINLIMPDAFSRFPIVALTGLLCLISHGYLYPILIYSKKRRKPAKVTKTKIWDLELHNKNLPIRGIIARDILYFTRVNRFFLLKYVAYAAVVNFFSILFIINNQIYNFVYAAFILQYFISIVLILDLPNTNNQVLLTSSKKYLKYILKAELFIWSSLFLIQFIAVLVLYINLIGDFSEVILLVEFILIELLLVYGLLLKNTSEAGMFYFVVSIFLPPLIPSILYNSYKELR